MTGIFSIDMNRYFESSEGSYTNMTQVELNKRTFNVKSSIRDMLISHLGYDNIPRVKKTEKQSILFNLYGETILTKDIDCKFSKEGKNEMTIYLDKNITENCQDGDIWFVFFKENESTPFLGTMKQEKWEKLSYEVELDGDNELDSALTREDNEYPMYNINVEKGFYTVYELKRKYDSPLKKIILDAEFQRESVWKQSQKSELIESILMGLPLPIFYFNQNKMGKLIVIDGRQRLTALFEFMSNDWALKGLKVLRELNGLKFSDLNPIVQSKIEDYQIQAHVIQPPTPDRIKFDIFDRVNRAGTQLNKQEIRNALYQGKSTILLKELSESDYFKEATEGAFIKDTRMKGKYILLRFIAFEMLFEGNIKNGNSEYEYKNDIDELLGLAMDSMNEMTDDKLEIIKSYVILALKNTNKILGENAFRLIRSNGSKSPINMNVFETVTHIMKNIKSTEDIDFVELKHLIDNMKTDSEFKEAIGNHRDNYNKVISRFEIANKIIKKVSI